MFLDEINERFPKGEKVSGIVCQHRHFGFLLRFLEPIF